MTGQKKVNGTSYAALTVALVLGCAPSTKTHEEPTHLRVPADGVITPSKMAVDALRSSVTQDDLSVVQTRRDVGTGTEPPPVPEKASESPPEPKEKDAVAPTPQPATPRCIKQGKALKVFAVGSSTMAGLAFVMRKPLKKRGADFESGAKPSSGLSRPDFYDWPAEIPKIVKRVDPDVFIVSMGTNDNQAVRLADRSWVRPNQPQWEKVYRERIQKMLKGMNEGRQRRIIWIGPNSVHGRKKGSRRYRINEMMKDEVTRFAGDTHYINLYRLITHEKSGRVRRLIQRKSDGRYFKARAKDGVHLSLPALRFLLAEKVYEYLEACFSAQGLKRRLAHVPQRHPRRRIDARPSYPLLQR